MKQLAFLFLFTCGTIWAQPKPLTIGVVTDGPTERLAEDFEKYLKPEIITLTSRDFEVRFPQDKVLNSNFTHDTIDANLTTLLEDPEVDMVICIGVLSTLEAVSRGGFDKPVVAPYGIDASMPIYPNQNGTSGMRNFNYLVTPGSIERDAAILKRLQPIKRVHFLVQDAFAQLIPGVQAFVENVFHKEGLEVVFVQVHTHAEPVLEQLKSDPQGVEMVYLTPPIHFSKEEKQKLINGITDLDLPSFSLMGKEDVRMGVLAGLAPETDRLRWFRRAALNIQRILLGEQAAAMPVLLKENSKLTLNMATARAINWYPSWDLQIGADILNEEPKKIARRLNLTEAVNRAIEVNLEVAAATAETLAGEQDIKQAQARRLPQLEADVTGTRVDEDTAAASFGSVAETSVTGNLTLQQLLYSDGANAAVAMTKLAQTSREAALDAKRLDIALAAATRYLNYLKAKTVSRVQKNNLDLTSSHLETAETRRNIGLSGPAEVYRWQSQLARDRQQALNSRNQADAALYALNQVLHEHQETYLQAEEPNLANPALITSAPRLTVYVGNALKFSMFRAFMVKEGLAASPELRRLDALIEVKKLEIRTGKRSYVLPTVSMQGRYRHSFERDIIPVTFPIEGFMPAQPKDDGWDVSLQFKLPLFQGGTRKAALAQDRIELEALELQRNSVAEQIELAIRARLQQVAASRVAIDQTRISAEAARKNYELVKDGYAKGVATSIDLLDAQTAELSAELAGSNALYDFMLELMNLERVTAKFHMLLTPPEREAWFTRLEKYYETYQ